MQPRLEQTIAWLLALAVLATLPVIYWLKIERPERVVSPDGPDIQLSPLSAAQAAAAQDAAVKSSGLAKRFSLPLANGVAIKLVLIPPGRFAMGSPSREPGRQRHEGPQHAVTMSQPFYLGACEVTQHQWVAVMGATTRPWLEAGQPRQNVREDPACPASYIDWNAANEFCRRASAATGRRVRLPTEAEWEYACRAGTASRFACGDEAASLATAAWFDATTTAPADRYPHPVATKHPNAWGLFDMHGNVMEWCADRFEANYYSRSPARDPANSADSIRRVIRGGSFDVTASACRSAVRGEAIASNDWPMFGFRVVVEVDRR